MNEQIKQIAERLKGLRESLDLSPEEMADRCGRRVEEVVNCESGETDIPMGFLYDVAQRSGVDISTFLSGDEPKMTSYFLTRYGQGLSVERTRAYRYQTLAGGYKRPKVEPFEVTVEPDDRPIFLNSHVGEEFNYVLEGRMLFCFNGKNLVLNPGDSVYFDSSYAHGMKALDGRSVKFLAVIS
jgi:quercetin dioxygenase-like cupin family protein